MKTDIHIGDCRKILKDLPADAAHTCVTSPPYWGLRDYGNAGQLGLERSPEEYVENLVAVFREVKRVLRTDGTLWLNLGDNYAGYKPGKGVGYGTGKPHYGLKAKDLCGIPWRVAFALQADGWYLRSDIVWAKPAPNPESVTDRCTKAHEYIFMLTRRPQYYYDADAIKTESGANRRSVWDVAATPTMWGHPAGFPQKIVERCVLAGSPEGGTCLDPFAGSGTVGLVSSRLSRHSILIEINADYAEKMAAKRIYLDAPHTNSVSIQKERDFWKVKSTPR